jgi:hypothetical protein
LSATIVNDFTQEEDMTMHNKYTGRLAIAVTAASIGVLVIAAAIYKRRQKDERINDGRNNNDNNDDNNDVGKTENELTADMIHNLPPHLKREFHKEERRQFMIPKLTMKKPMYDNIQMYSPQEKLLCTISIKKANWYISKHLAHWKDSQHTCIQLLFSPRQTPRDPSQIAYNQSPKHNHCVVCGWTQDYMRHYVVPYCYRSLLPLRYKTHLPHDVVVLCARCHVHAERHAHQRMRQLEDALRVDPATAHAYIVDTHIHRLKSAAMALLRRRDKLPLARLQEYEALVRDYYHLKAQEDIPMELLYRAETLEDRTPNPHFISGPELVLQHMDTDESSIEQFVRAWRRHFLDVNQPRYLPHGWSVDSAVACDVRPQVNT